ncbi:MAG: hypothetical protein GEV07_26690 [Streptosporangiales bacterium]|nr:hypothetical protein [Streptosporangiales bacterium]
MAVTYIGSDTLTRSRTPLCRTPLGDVDVQPDPGCRCSYIGHCVDMTESVGPAPDQGCVDGRRDRPRWLAIWAGSSRRRQLDCAISRTNRSGVLFGHLWRLARPGLRSGNAFSPHRPAHFLAGTGETMNIECSGSM